MADFASSRAVIVGINAYGNGVPALRSAVNDAQDLAKSLEADHGYAVMLLTDGAATLAGLKQCFEEELPQQVGDQDRVLVYFAGHGIAEEGDDGPTGYLLPQDARADDRASFLAMETFHEWLGKLPCRHLLVVLDCCFAGAFRWTKQTRHLRAPLEVIHRERYERFVRHPAWQAIASTAYDQEALDTIAGKVLGLRQAPDNTPNSPFARALLEGLKGEADLVPKNGDGVIVGYELATFLQDSVSRCADDARHEQMPCIWSLGKEDSGQFVFLLPHFDPDTLKPAPVLDAENNPYRGLRAYEENDAGLFFGREKVVEDLAAVVKKQPLTMVLGASGTGKSSLVHAGLLAYPRAVLFGKDAATEGVFHRLLMRPADAPATPLRGLIMQLSKVGAAAPSAASSEGVTDETPAAAIAAFSAWFAADPQRHLFLVIDQFEELVTLCSNAVRTAFLEFLADLLDHERERLRIVLTLRSDFEPQFADSALRRHLQAGVGTSEARFLVPPLQHHEFREIIEKPASERVLFFEPPALVDRLITEVIQMPGALPLLSFALSELYLKYVERQTAAQQRGEIIDRAITDDDYRQLGGVVGALSKRASEEYDDCDETHRRTMQRVMLRMVATEGELARRRVPRGELIYPRPEETERAGAVVERLEKARLVVSGRTDGNGSEDGDAGSEYVEPAHDALVRSWSKLLDWQREAAAELPVQRRLAEAANEWQRRNRHRGLMWTADPRLALVRQQLRAPDGWLNARESEYVKASMRRKRRETGIRAAAIAGLVLLTLVSVAVAFIALSERQNAERLLGSLLGERFLGEVRDVGRSTMLEQVQEQSSGSVLDQSPALLRGLARRNAGDIERTHGNLSKSVKFFEQALEFFESSPDDPASPREAARTHERMGEALRDQGQVREGLSHYEAAVKAWRQVVAGGPAAATVDCTNLAESLVSAGDLKYRMGGATLARTDLEEALKIATTLLVGRQTLHDQCGPMAGKAEPYPDAKVLEVFSHAVMLRAQILNFEEDYDGVAALAMEARRLRPTSVSAKRNAFEALVWRGDGQIHKQPQPALDDYRNALAGFEELRRWDPDNRLWQRERAAIQLRVSGEMVACQESKDCKPMPSLEEAEATSLEAIATVRALAGIDRTNFSLQSDLGWALQEHARVLASQDRKAERLARLEESEKFYISSKRDPADAGSAADLGRLLLDKVDALAVLDRQAEAEAALQRSIDLFNGLIAAHRDNSSYVAHLSAARQSQAKILRKTGDRADADAADREVTRLDEQYQETTGSNNQKAEKHKDLHIPHVNEGARLFNGGDHTAALGEFKAAESFLWEYIWLRPTDSSGYDGLRNIYRWIQLTQEKLGNAEEGTAAIRASMYAAQIAALLAPEDNEMINNMLEARHNLGTSLYRDDRLDEALAMVQEEIVIAEKLVQGASGRVHDAEHTWRLGDAKFGLSIVRRELNQDGWEEALQSALIHAQKAVEIDTKNPAYQNKVGQIRKYLAEQLDGDGRKKEASAEYRLALEAYQRAATISPADQEARDVISQAEGAIRELAGRGVR